MSTASTGRRIEHAVRDDLTAHGWLVAARAAGSKGPADLVAVRPNQVAFVQVKRTDPRLSPYERARLVALADRLGHHIALPIVACKPLRQEIAYRLLTGPGPRDWVPWQPGLDGDAPDVFDPSVAPGGHVCGVCGWSTESEPCPEHQSNAYAQARRTREVTS